jgi:hypothetical protein
VLTNTKRERHPSGTATSRKLQHQLLGPAVGRFEAFPLPDRVTYALTDAQKASTWGGRPRAATIPGDGTVTLTAPGIRAGQQLQRQCQTSPAGTQNHAVATVEQQHDLFDRCTTATGLTFVNGVSSSFVLTNNQSTQPRRPALA